MAVDKLPQRNTALPKAVPATPATSGTAGTPAASAKSATTSVTADSLETPHHLAETVVGHSPHKAPVTVATSTNARSILVDHVKESRAVGGFNVEQRKFLRTAAKALDGGASLEAHLSLRDLARDLGCAAAFDEIMRAHGAQLLPELLDKANVFAGADALRGLGELASTLHERAAFDVHVAEQLTVALSWAKTDGERTEVEALARALGLSVVTETPPATSLTTTTRTRPVTESMDAVRKSRRMITKNPTAWAGYQKILALLQSGEAGKNQHALTREYAGMWAADLPGSGSGRGAQRVIYAIVDDQVVVHDITDYH